MFCSRSLWHRQRTLLESNNYPEQIVRYQDRPIRRIDSIDSAGFCRLPQGDSRLKWLCSQLWCPRCQACPATWCRFALQSRPHGCLLANALNFVSFFFFPQNWTRWKIHTEHLRIPTRGVGDLYQNHLFGFIQTELAFKCIVAELLGLNKVVGFARVMSPEVDLLSDSTPRRVSKFNKEPLDYLTSCSTAGDQFWKWSGSHIFL